MLDPPHTETNYLLHEMAFRIGRRHARKLRRLSYAQRPRRGAGPELLTLLGLGRRWPACWRCWRPLAGLAGVAIERWLFFAEARHTVTLYYRRRAA